MKKIFLLVAVLALLDACASTRNDTKTTAADLYQPEHRALGRPPVGVIKTARPSEVLYRQTPYLLHDSIRLIDAITLGDNRQYTLNAGYYDRIAGAQKNKLPTFAANKFAGSGSIVAVPGAQTVKWLELREVNVLCLVAQGDKNFCSDTANVQRLIRRAPLAGELQQSLVFRGLDDNTLTLNYRETSTDMSMVMFEKSLAYNARQSRIISYAGLVLEILEVSPSLIRYRINHAFAPVGEARF